MKKKILSVLLALTMLTVPAVADTNADAPLSITAEAASSKLAKPTVKVKVKDGKITLSWNKVKGAEAYGVYKYNTSTKKYTKVKITAKTKITINVKKSGTYKYRVYSLDKVNGKYKKGGYSYKKVEVDLSNDILDEVMEGIELGDTKNEVIKVLGGRSKVVVDGDVVIKPVEDDGVFYYMFENNKLIAYGVGYDYSDEGFDKLLDIFDNDEWYCITEDIETYEKEDLSYEGLIYIGNDGLVAGVMHETNNDIILALVVTQDRQADL